MPKITIGTAKVKEPIAKLLATLTQTSVKAEREGLVAKTAKTHADYPSDVFDLASQICAVGRINRVRSVTVEAESSNEAPLLMTLAQLVPVGNPRLSCTASESSVVFTAPDNTPQPRRRRTVPRPRMTGPSQACD